MTASSISFKPIGHLKSVFKFKAGTPRQSGICAAARGSVRILRDVVNNPQYALEDLEHYSHVWVIFVFHKNGQKQFVKSKVHPPRLNGKKVGLFSTRTPHRPNPIGLTLAKLDRVAGDTIYLSGIDIIDGTPVLDIKPFIPMYDNPLGVKNNVETELCEKIKSTTVSDGEIGSDSLDRKGKEIIDCENQSSSDLGEIKFPKTDSYVLTDKEKACFPKGIEELEKLLAQLNKNISVTLSEKMQKHQHGYCNNCVKVAGWVHNAPVTQIEVTFSDSALKELKQFHKDHVDPLFKFEFLNNGEEAREAILQVLKEDPRSTYFRNENEKVFKFTIDNLNVHCCFNEGKVKVTHIESIFSSNIVMSKLQH